MLEPSLSVSEHAILSPAEVCRWHAGECVSSGQLGVKLAAAGVFAAGRQRPGLGLPPNRCWFVSELWLNSWTAFQHTGERKGGLEQ